MFNCTLVSLFRALSIPRVEKISSVPTMEDTGGQKLKIANLSKSKEEKELVAGTACIDQCKKSCPCTLLKPKILNILKT